MTNHTSPIHHDRSFESEHTGGADTPRAILADTSVPVSDDEARPSARRPHGWMRHAMIGLAALAATVAGLVVTPNPAEAASSATVCFDYYNSWYQRWESGANLTVRMYYYDGRAWTYAGSGYDRKLPSTGCVSYNLASLRTCSGTMCLGGPYDWSGQYVRFSVLDVQPEAHFWSKLTQWVSPGRATYNIRGSAFCSGRLCR